MPEAVQDKWVGHPMALLYHATRFLELDIRDNETYILYLDEDKRVLNDSWASSAEEAMRVVSRVFGIGIEDWIPGSVVDS